MGSNSQVIPLFCAKGFYPGSPLLQAESEAVKADGLQDHSE